MILKQDILKIIGPKIKKARIEKGYTQEYVAENINISTDLVRNIENCRNVGSITTLINLCNILGISMDYLFLDFLSTPEQTIDTSLYSQFSKISNEDKDVLKKIIIYLDKNYLQ